MGKTLTTKIVGFTIASKAGSLVTRDQVETFLKRLKEHEGMPTIDESSDYMVHEGDQDFYFRRLLSSNPVVSRLGFMEKVEETLQFKNSGTKIGKGCSPDKDDCVNSTITQFVPAERVIFPYYIKDAILRGRCTLLAFGEAVFR